MTENRSPPTGVILALIAATISSGTASQLLLLAFVEPPPNTPWEIERAELLEEWLWMVKLSPILAIPVLMIATPALLLLHHLRQTSWLAYALAGAMTGVILCSWLASSRAAEGWMPRWAQGAAVGAVGALTFWAVLWLYCALKAWFLRATAESTGD